MQALPVRGLRMQLRAWGTCAPGRFQGTHTPALPAPVSRPSGRGRHVQDALLPEQRPAPQRWEGVNEVLVCTGNTDSGQALHLLIQMPLTALPSAFGTLESERGVQFHGCSFGP